MDSGDDGTGFGGDFGATFGVGGEDGNAGYGPAGPGPSEDSEAGVSDYGSNLSFGDMADSGSSDLGSVLSQLALQTDLTDLGSLFGQQGIPGVPDVSMGMPATVSSEDMSQFGKVVSALQALARGGQALGKGGTLGALAAASPLSIATSQNPAESWGKSAITTGLGMAFGPMGALAGTALNSLGVTDAFTGALGSVNNGGFSATAEGTPGIGNGMMDALPGLMGLYANYQGQKQSGDMLSGLQGLYSQNSPYAQMLRQQLQRRDAASGRRSQYGGREVELQAKLAQMASSQIPAMSQISNNQTMQRNQMLQQGLGAFQRLGGINALRDLFRTGPWESSVNSLMPNMPNSFDLSNIFPSMTPDMGFNFDMPTWGG